MKLKIAFAPLLAMTAVLASVPRAAAADEVVAVLSSNLGPYQEALAGFQESFGRSVPTHVLSDGEPKIPSGVRIIVAIGGKAAVYPYPSDAFLVYCLAPGTKLKHDEHPAGLLHIHVSPSVTLAVSKLKELQPSLKRLAVIWAGDSIQDCIDKRKEVAERLGVEMISDRLRDPDDLPNHLRALKGKIDAIWLPPDAAVVTPKNFATIKEFSYANGIPFYVSSDGLVQHGAVASVSASFSDMGALAAEMTRLALSGSLKVDQIFPEKIHVFVNLAAAKSCNLNIAAEVLRKAEKVIP